MPLREAVAAKFAPVGRAARRAGRRAQATWNGTKTGARWVRYGWQLTAAPRAGYGSYRTTRRHFIKNVRGEFEYQELRTIANEFHKGVLKNKKREGALEDARAKRVSIDRQAGPRFVIGNLPTLTTLGGGAYLHAILPWWQEAGTAVLFSIATVGGLTLMGQRSEDLPEAQRPQPKGALSAPALREALLKLGIPELTKAMTEDPESIYVSDPVELADKSGWMSIVELTAGIKRSKVMGARELLAQNLRAKHLSCLTLTEGESTTEIIVTLTKVPANKRAKAEWKLPGQVDIFDTFEIGHTAIGGPVSTGIESALLAIGRSGWGKSMALQLLTTILILDPLVRLRLGVFASSGDYAAFEPIAEQSVIGDATEPAIAGQGAEFISGLKDESIKRGQLLKQLGEPKVTRALAEQYRELRPIVVVLDEIQVLFPNAAAAKADLLTLASKCRKHGIFPIVATPRIDKTIIDTNFVSNSQYLWMKIFRRLRVEGGRGVVRRVCR
jgi:hypothetical protein